MNMNERKWILDSLYKTSFHLFVGGMRFSLRPRVGMCGHQHGLVLFMRKYSKASISCSSDRLNVPHGINESTAKVIYSVAPAMGHNKVINLHYSICHYISSRSCTCF